MNTILDFLNSIEGHGYGGIAAFEIAREDAKSAANEIERLTTLVELQRRKISTQHEDLATFMMKHSFSTGHGDSHADLLAELGPQIDKLRGALAAAQAYAKHERDLGAEELAQANVEKHK